jgi:hypothetical protein
MKTLVRRKAIVMAMIVLGALVLPLALLLGGGWSMWREHRADRTMRAAHAEALRESLERAADVAMPVPTLTEEVIELDLPLEQIEGELQRVVRLARGVGGTAASWNDGKTVRIVANVPSTAAGIFRDAVTGKVVSITAAGDSKLTTVVQIVLRPAEGS